MKHAIQLEISAIKGDENYAMLLKFAKEAITRDARYVYKYKGVIKYKTDRTTFTCTERKYKWIPAKFGFLSKTVVYPTTILTGYWEA